ncbi:MAG TPA: tRNA (N6-isopentenyl adenosine(37)-C2)-methylthiotransferase MiaB [Ornithinibacter sp.]|nr:tRNA (N6-isopentenyl adenosine(37)-C2)-methylthiotransferase MiaB [Ornithinibacter sp.]
MTAPRTYDVRTHGCQMNVHDSERLAGLLETAGYVDLASVPAAVRPEVADVVVFNTCAVRENADNKLYGNLGQLRPAKTANPDLQIAVGGCMAQKDRETIVARAPWVDVVFGTHNIGSLPALLDRARHNKRAEVEILESLETFPATLPTRRDSAFSGWVSISVGCNNTCTFCIVPSLRGKEQDRRPGEVLAEVEALVAQGVVEVTLLGQNVNTSGVEFGDRLAFGKLLRACGAIEGLERVRFTSPHPAAFTDDVIAAMAETPNVMPSLHMPLQSGSDRVLRAMRRSYRSERFLRILDQVRAGIPDAAITTDLIVGFPGETEEDFTETLRVVEASRFSSAFTFQYSVRPGTPAATMADQVPKAVVQERFERLIELQERVSWAENRALEGREVEVLVAPGEGRKDGVTARLSGRARDNRLVHVAVPDGAERPRPGDVVTVDVTYGAPHHLVADSGVQGGAYAVRRTAGGEAWAALQGAAVPGKPAVSLGMPSLGRPPAAVVAPACSA